METESKIKYPLAKHHAWGGLALLSLISILRLLLPGFPDYLAFPLIGALFLYVLIWLGLTYRYRKELGGNSSAYSPGNGQEDKAEKKAAKNRLKLDKKRAKAALKRNK